MEQVDFIRIGSKEIRLKEIQLTQLFHESRKWCLKKGKSCNKYQFSFYTFIFSKLCYDYPVRLRK